MSRITFDQFLKLSPEERQERIYDLSPHDLFITRMNDWGGSIVVEEPDINLLTEEQRRQQEIIDDFIKNWRPSKEITER